MYTHKCDKCNSELDILRPFSESDSVPNEEDPNYPKDIKCEHDWKKILHRFRLTRGNNWSGKKGSWIYLATILGSSLLCKSLDMFL